MKAIVFESTDFLYSGIYGSPPWVGGALATGTLSSPSPPSAAHPGLVRFSSHVSNANSGYRFYISNNALLLAGLETSELIFQLTETHASTVIRFGFLDTIDHNAPVDGVYFYIANNILSGKARNNSSESETVTTFTLDITTWYHAKLSLNSAASIVTFDLYDSDGNLLWSDSLTTNIPTTRLTGHGIFAHSTDPDGVVKNLIDADYMDLAINRAIVR